MPSNRPNGFGERPLKARIGKEMGTFSESSGVGVADKRRVDWKTAKRIAGLTTE